jgi:hypothetical protein
MSRSEQRSLGDLESVGRETLRDFEVLGIRSVAALARKNPERLYEDLCRRTGARHDICVLDVLHCAVAQARNPRLAAEKRKWWYWSRLRKARGTSPER